MYQCRSTYLCPRQGSLDCWSHSGPVQPPSHSQVKPDWLVATQVPCTQTFLWQGSQPGTIPVCRLNILKSCSSLFMYKLRMQPWKLVPLCPGDWRSTATLFFIGIPALSEGTILNMHHTTTLCQLEKNLILEIVVNAMALGVCVRIYPG